MHVLGGLLLGDLGSMNTPRVLIFEDSTFHRRLMSDLVECNDLKAVPVDGSDWVARLENGSDRAAVVVVDFDRPKREAIDVVKRLHAIPTQRRPRIVGVVRGQKGKLVANVGSLGCEEVIEGPFDTGNFARAVVRQAAEARRLALA